LSRQVKQNLRWALIAALRSLPALDWFARTQSRLIRPFAQANPHLPLKPLRVYLSDCYSLGIILFEILDRHRFEPLPDLRALNPEVPESLIGLVERLTAKSPEQRPGDEEMLAVLGALAED